MAFAFSEIPYPPFYQFTLRFAFPCVRNTGLTRSA